jgi:hypothetical protein
MSSSNLWGCFKNNNLESTYYAVIENFLTFLLFLIDQLNRGYLERKF